MKKNITAIMLIALSVVLIFTGCATDNGSGVTTKTIRVIGTAEKATSASKALSRAAAPAETENLTIASVDSVVVNGKDIKDDLKPVAPATDGQNNVTFEAQVEVPSKVSFSAEAKDGFIFDEWEVLEVESEDGNAVADEKLLEEIEDWLEIDGRKNKETLTDVPAEYITYLVAEYDNGYHIALDADSKTENNITVDEFVALDYTEDELTLVLSGTDNEEFTKLMNAINAMADLEELKIKSAGATLTGVPALDKLEEIALSGFTFTDAIEINKAKNEYKFVDCDFQADLTITNVKEMEIKNSKAKTITVTAAEELELENVTLTTLDLSAMEKGAGEVEIEMVTGTIKDPNGVAQIEADED